MMIIRTAFFLGVVVLLLPTDEKQQARVYDVAVVTVRRAATFCDRNGEMCAQGAAHWATFKQKLDFGTRMAVNLASEHLLGRAQAVSSSQSVSDTLKPADLSPAWREPAPRARGA